MLEWYVKFVTDNEIPARITLMVVSSAITTIAMLIALFKEDIRNLFVHPKVELSKTNSLRETTAKTGSGVIEAVEYSYKVNVTNSGRVPVNKAEVYLDKLTKWRLDSTNHEEIETDGVPLKWNNSDINQIMIPSSSRKSITLFKILPPDQTTTPDASSKKTNSQPRIKIGDNTYDVEVTSTEWAAIFSIYSENAKTVSLHLRIKWNGKWHARLAELNKDCSVTEGAANE